MGKLSVKQRKWLFDTLSSLPLSEFLKLEFMLEVPSSVMPDITAASGVRTSALVRYLQSPMGKGLNSLAEVFELLDIPGFSALEAETAQEESKKPETLLQIALEGETETVNRDNVWSYLAEIQKLAPGSTIIINNIYAGSILFNLQGQPEALQQIKEQVDTRRATTILGLTIQRATFVAYEEPTGWLDREVWLTSARAQRALTLPVSEIEEGRLFSSALAKQPILPPSVLAPVSQREQPRQINNGEEGRYRDEGHKLTYLATFTKGLPHNEHGMVAVPQETSPLWISEIARATEEFITVRELEIIATVDRDQSDSRALTMPPAPTLDSPELVAEMIELYAMALLRDIPFAEFETSADLQKAISWLNQTPWLSNPGALLSDTERARLRGPMTVQTVFRGMTAGDVQGPYLSQFLLIGTESPGDVQKLTDGFITDGSIRIDQRIRQVTLAKDFMTNWETWLDVQNGADLRGLETYETNSDGSAKYRFIATPRDLATYIHNASLHSPYLNAFQILVAMRVPLAQRLALSAKAAVNKKPLQMDRSQILSLLMQAARRALEAVHFQKFSVHRRARPEVVGGWIHQVCNGYHEVLQVIQPLADSFTELGVTDEIASHNVIQNQGRHPSSGVGASFLLPMAFPEGSPMNPSYGSGRAAVAGASVTLLKAFFDHDYKLPGCYESVSDGLALQEYPPYLSLTVEGELNKLASNIGLGCCWAGVNYYSDYIESLRLGEQVALRLLEEQKASLGQDLGLTIPLFDRGTVYL